MRELCKIWVVPATLFFLLGCSDDTGPTEPPGPDPINPEDVQINLSCEVQLGGGGSITCEPATPHVAGGASASIFSDRDALVHLETLYLTYEAGVLTAEIAIRSNLMQPMGTEDGKGPDANGVRAFFIGDPVTTGGTGEVTVRNADGTDDFTGSGDVRPYFQYAQALAPGKATLPKNWEWDVPATVESFTFELGVFAKVLFPDDLKAGLNFNVTTLAADSLHTCVLNLMGEPFCWGSGGSGRLGNLGMLQESLPVPTVTGGEQFITVEAGLAHTCGLTVKGEAWCWGSGGDGRLGNGGTAAAYTPVRVFGDITFVQMAVGRTHTCALEEDGTAWCWGGGGNGKLGNGSTNSSPLPLEVLGGLKYTWLSSGSFHTCGIATTGDSYCWGSATNGKRGDGITSGTLAEPSKVLGGHIFTKIYAGEQHTCALKQDGEAWCWGRNAAGQLGTGTFTSSSQPVKVTGGHRFVTIAMGFDYTCGVATTGKAYCWGSNAHGKLGIGQEDEASVPTPTEVVEVEGFTAIGAGIYHTCGATVTGDVYCWGIADNGRLGTGATTDTPTPTRVSTLSGMAFMGAPPASCGDVATGASATCFPRRPLQERIELALAMSDRFASDLL